MEESKETKIAQTAAGSPDSNRNAISAAANTMQNATTIQMPRQLRHFGGSTRVMLAVMRRIRAIDVPDGGVGASSSGVFALRPTVASRTQANSRSPRPEGHPGLAKIFPFAKLIVFDILPVVWSTVWAAMSSFR